MTRFVDLFALWVVLASLLALVHPAAFGWLDLAWISPMLGGIMLGMGLSLRWDDFARVGRMPRPILTGVALQFGIMPALGYLVGRLFGLETPFAVGLVLVASCPGGTASNVIAFVARADVALSVSMTTLSTLASVIATPYLTALLAGSQVDVDPQVLLLDTAKVVLLPVLAGLGLRTLAPRLTRLVLPFAAPMAVSFIVLIVAGVLASVQPALLESGPRVLAAVALVHVLGATLGYLLSQWVFRDTSVARTTAIEVGMQNAGLGVALARGGAFVDPLVAVPCALGAGCTCLLGSALAALWSRAPLAPHEGNAADSQAGQEREASESA